MQALWSMVLASLLLDMSLTSDLDQAGLKATRSRLKYEAPKSDFKSAAIKKKRTEEGATAQRQKKKGQPASSKDKFALSVQDMLAEGWDGRQMEFKNEAGTTPDYCPRYNCEPDPKMDWKSINVTEGQVDGSFHSLCNAIYFIGAVKKTWRGAAADCCKRNMRLITVTRAEEATCVIELFNEYSLKLGDEGIVLKRMWVAASDRGEEGAFKWCYPERLDNFQFPPFMPFEEGEPSNIDEIENCLDVSTNFKFNDADCNLKQLYVCESTHPKREAVVDSAMKATPLNTVPDCPRYFCDQNPSKKNDESDKKEADAVASLDFKYSCGRKFYMENYFPKSWKNAAADCCSKGMRLLTIENSYKRECITELLKALGLVYQPESGMQVTNWWWLAASDKLKEGTFRWCFPQKSKKIKSTPPIPFAKNSPDSRMGNEDCLGMHLQIDTAFLDDKHCDMQAPYICESLTALTKNDHEIGNTTDLCPRYYCVRDNPEDHLQCSITSTRLNLGTTMESCNFEFFFANVTKTWREAASECCRRNMGLLKVSNDKKLRCLKEAFVKGNLPPNRWWIGSSDKAQEGKFRWCFPNSADLHESTLPLPFAKGEPGENQDAEDCLEIINRNDVLALNDRACEVSAHFICEEEHEGQAMSGMSWLLKTGSVSTTGMRTAHGSQNTFFTACYRFYALIKPKKFTQSKGASECCKYGLKVASLDSPLELQCVKQFLATEPGTYWTSGTGLDGEFAWCPSGKGIDGDLWIPSDKPKSKKCVSLVIGDAISGLENSSCDVPQHVLCESNFFF